MSLTVPRLISMGFALILGTSTLSAEAFPGFFVGKNDAKRALSSGSVLVMNQGEDSAVTIVTDYGGPFEPFAVVFAVPDDVVLERVSSIRREYVDRIDQISAPRFFELWEMDPCDPSQVLQEWDRDLRVTTSSDNFLGGAAGELGPTRKVPKELLLSVKTAQKSGEYSFFMAESEQSFLDLARGRGWSFSPAMEQAVNGYLGQGMRFVLAEVDTNRIELIGGDRAQLSPIHFTTEKPYRKIPSKLSRLSAEGHQELFVFVLDPNQRFVTTNYESVPAPSNIEVDFIVKERMAEFYAGLHDLWLAKHPRTFWLEYVWGTDGCGEPCPNEPILINELLTLGGDFFERRVSDEEKNPKPDKMTDEEKAKLKMELEGLMPKERPKHKKMVEEERVQLAARRALLARHKYVITRLHHRYADDGLPNDVEIGPNDQGIEGGIWLPKGEKKEISTETRVAENKKLQTRYLNYHPWKGMQNCEGKERWRWGKPPRTYRGLRKTWVVEDLARKSRTQIVPAQVIQNPIPALGLVREEPKPVNDGGVDAGTEATASSKGCGCRVSEREPRRLTALLATLLTGLLLLRRRRTELG